jgi:outer membrane biogenesis lipoprotein LolB
MIQKPILFAVAAALLAGCTTTVLFDKPDATPLSFAQDKYQCEQETQGAGNYSAYGSPMYVAVAQSNAKKNAQAMFVSCMEARDYQVHR